MKYITDIKQNTDEWLKFKLGKLSGSTFKNIGVTKETKGENDFLLKLYGEIITGKADLADSIMKGAKALEHGNKYEPTAVKAYERTYNKEVDRSVGIVDISQYECYSPDGFLNNRKAGLEIKCPISFKEHSRVLTTKKINPQHLPQVKYFTYQCNLEYVDFVSFHPLFFGTGKDITLVRYYANKKDEMLFKAQRDRFISNLVKLLKI